MWGKLSCLRKQHTCTPGWRETKWNNVSCLRTQKLCTPGWRETKWNKVSCLRTTHLYSSVGSQGGVFKILLSEEEKALYSWIKRDNVE